MLNLLEKSFLLGLGVLSVTKNTAEKFVDEAIGKSQMTPEEGNAFIKTFSEEGEKAKKQIEDAVADVLKTRGHSLMPCHKTLVALEEKIKELEDRVAALENADKKPKA